jgi:DegV family protein with EDD domain
MPEVAVVTDTTHYLPAELVAECGVREVSLYVNNGDGQEREADIRNLDAFYEDLRAAASLPTTSQPSIGDFLAVYGPLIAQGRDIVSVHISGGISGTVEAARQAAAELADRGVGVPGPGSTWSTRACRAARWASPCWPPARSPAVGATHPRS